MNNSEILKLIKVKELEIKKLQLEVDKLKKQFNEITTNSSEDILGREDSVKIFMDYFKGRNDVYPHDVLFLTMPISGQTRVTQYAGRLHRQDSNKKEILIYDYIDDNFPKTRNMFLKRKKIYEKLGYEIVEEN